MLRVSSEEFQGAAFERTLDAALKQPVLITRDGRASLVLLAMEEYQRLTRRDRVVFRTEGLSEAELEAIGKVEMDPPRETRNGIALLPVRPNAAPVTPELVNQLRDE